MTFFEFASNNPGLTLLLSIVVMVTVVSVFEALAGAVRRR